MSDLPRKAASRTVRLARLPIGMAGRATMGLGKRLGGQPAEQVMNEFQRRTAEQLFKVFGELKGGAMKFGQALSVFEAAMPEQLAEPYRAALSQLQDSAPPMPTDTVHRVLAEELGANWRRRLTRFDDTPAAAASIGQVHRARWPDGRQVAVKIQYPGAADALRSDLNQIGRFARLFVTWMPGLEVRPLVEELKTRIIEELDYAMEAEAQTAFASAYADDPEFAVPAVVAQTPHVLVTEWMDGTPLREIIAEGDQETRDRVGHLLVRFLFSGPERAGMLHADPHPGNFRLTPDGRLGVVDYGLVARLPDGLPYPIGRLLRIALDGDFTTVVDGLRAEGFIKSGIDIDPAELYDYLNPFIEPARQESFSFNRAWMREQAQRVGDPRRPGVMIARKLNVPPTYLLIHRVWLGGVGVLSQLEARAPFRDELERWLPGFGAGTSELTDS